MQAAITPRTASTPRAWPATRGILRFLAQRPLPSMMIATWRGTAATSGTPRVELLKGRLKIHTSREAAQCRSDPGRSDLHQLLFLLGQELVDLGDVLVGELLDV